MADAFGYCVLCWLLLAANACSHSLAQPQPEDKAALVVIDVQNCFMPKGTLAVDDGDAVVPVINSLALAAGFEMVAYTQDWHPAGHVSFASTHPGKQPGEVLSLEYSTSTKQLCGYHALFPAEVTTDCSALLPSQLETVQQRLWPDHCIANTSDAQLYPALTLPTEAVMIHKGTRVHVDAYSAFYDNGKIHQTGLHAILQRRGITRLYVTGVALDYCVLWSSRDAAVLGYQVAVVSDAVRGVDPASCDAAVMEMESQWGIRYITSQQVLEEVQGKQQGRGLGEGGVCREQTGSCAAAFK